MDYTFPKNACKENKRAPRHGGRNWDGYQVVEDPYSKRKNCDGLGMGVSSLGATHLHHSREQMQRDGPHGLKGFIEAIRIVSGTQGTEGKLGQGPHGLRGGKPRQGGKDKGHRQTTPSIFY